MPDPSTALAVPEPRPDRLAEHFATAAALWGQHALPAMGRKPSAGPLRSSALGKALTAALRRDADLVLDAIRFVAESQHDKATFLREKRYDLDTVLRHLDSYAGLWREYGAAPPPQVVTPRPVGRPARPSSDDGVLASLFNETNARRLYVVDAE